MATVRHRVDANGVALSVLELGPPDGRPLVMLHGMRDVAWSLLPVAEPLAEHYRVLIPELRGHGDSDWPGGYAMPHFLYDTHRIVEALDLGAPAMIGHSLGGQILVRFAALFPERVGVAVLVEGLGPPARPEEADEAARLREQGSRIVAVLSVPDRQRPLPGLDFAAERLTANNPRLPVERARELADHATRRNAAGELVWAFDPRVQSVFVDVDLTTTEPYWRHVTCPTLVVSGDLAHEYWRAQLPYEWSGEFAPGELEARVASIGDAEHVAIPGAGHMVHYDQPRALTRAALDFLARRYPA
ncbi:MAG: alpha/beta fold hydrolase [Pseudomonadota bacterium]